MLITSQTKTSMLYDTLSSMGMLCSEERYIRKVREETEQDTFFGKQTMSYADLAGISYLYPHIRVKLEYKGYLEIWVDDQYQHPDKIQWIDAEPYSYCVLTGEYDPETQVCRMLYNPGIIYRYTIFNEAEPYAPVMTHSVTIDIREPKYRSLEYPDRAAYYISQNKIYVPEVEWIDDYHIKFTATYTRDIDFIITNDLVGVFDVKANIGTYIDSPTSLACYHHIVVDFDISYPIDARFYPCICVDKDCTVRVFSDSYHLIKYPEVQRLVNYPEFVDLDDPYNAPDSPYVYHYLKNLEPVDDIINITDSDQLIYSKFARISRFCYRIWQKFTKWSFEQSDFVICDNLTFGREVFKLDTIALSDVKGKYIYSTAPFEEYRDIIFYKGTIFSDYIIRPITRTTEGKLVENALTGQKSYLIPPEYDLDSFAIIKFNSWEDTNIANIGDYIDPKLTVELHTRMNRFYRNLMVIRNQILDHPEKDFVRVMTVPPTEKDNYLWFELILNVDPDMFDNNPALTIHTHNLDGKDLPENIKKGAYYLDMDPQNGPPDYKDMFMTYYTLTEEHSKYLALQYIDEKGPDPKQRIFYDVTVGQSEQIEQPAHGLHIEDDTMDEVYHEKKLDIGTEDQPDLDREIGDLYAQLDSVEPDIEEDDVFDDILSDLDTPEEELSDTGFFMDENTPIGMDKIGSFSREKRIQFVMTHIDQLSECEFNREHIELLTDDQLNHMVYKLMELGYVIDRIQSGDVDVSSIPMPADENEANELVEMNLRYIISNDVPDDIQLNDFWIQIDNHDIIEKYYKSMISHELIECGVYMPKNPYYGTNDKMNADEATFVFDYGAHDKADDSWMDIYKEATDPSLHEIQFDGTEPENPQPYDIWYEYLKDVSNRICYYDQQTMVIRVDERLVAIKLSDDNLEGFLFDDIAMNFHGKLGIRYLSILSDLINSHVIKQSDLMIFYRRLVTERDQFEAVTQRLYTGTSNVVALNKIDTSDFSIVYSSNIKRLTINYADESTSNKEREYAYKHCIYYKERGDFAFFADRMILFVNGKYIPRTEYHEEYGAYTIQLKNFDEIIAVVDILYSEHDTELMKLKRSAYSYWPLEDQAVMIERPEKNYERIQPIEVSDQTYQGFYDVLLNEYILNNKLIRILNYLEGHPDEAERFKNEFIHQFHTISDMELTDSITEWENPRIVIPAIGDDPVYEIKE